MSARLAGSFRDLRCSVCSRILGEVRGMSVSAGDATQTTWSHPLQVRLKCRNCRNYIIFGADYPPRARPTLDE